MPPAQTLRSAQALADAGLIAPERLPALERVAAQYAVAITADMAALIEPANAADPIARQFVPQTAELVSAPGEDPDPIGDLTHSPVEGIVHRYPDRVLLKPTHTCAVYCRFCFRREMVGPEGLKTCPRPSWTRPSPISPATGDLGGHRHRRRSAGAVAPPPARHRSGWRPSSM
jgi:lysine 2,3-aminomutase